LCEKENTLFICSNVVGGYERKVARFKRECINPNYAAIANERAADLSFVNKTTV
jgi:hypothetical protein